MSGHRIISAGKITEVLDDRLHSIMVGCSVVVTKRGLGEMSPAALTPGDQLGHSALFTAFKVHAVVSRRQILGVFSLLIDLPAPKSLPLPAHNDLTTSHPQHSSQLWSFLKLSSILESSSRYPFELAISLTTPSTCVKS